MRFFSASPFPYGDPHLETVNPIEKMYSHLRIFSSIPKWSLTPYGSGLVTGQSPYGNGDTSIPVSI